MKERITMHGQEVVLDGATLVASSRSGATEVYQLPDGKLLEVQHLKSGRSVASEVPGIPEYLTVRY